MGILAGISEICAAMGTTALGHCPSTANVQSTPGTETSRSKDITQKRSLRSTKKQSEAFSALNSE